jgi:hypothetical protein
MKNAVELLDVIESSHLPLSDALVERRADILKLVDSHIQKSSDPDAMAAELADLLVEEGVVLGDSDSVQEVIKEYLHVVADEEAGLGDDEKNFLESFLK